MQFFEQQRLCKKNTKLMLVLFAITVVLTALCTGLVFYITFEYTQETSMPVSLGPWYKSNFFLTPALCAGLFILVASVYKSSLNTTGKGIAILVGAKIVPSTTKNPLYRRLLNTVEEMSIASGVPIPEVFVQENENAINAFAAGTNLKGAVVCVTDGALKKLSRDELQSVIAHEFSHILNGDMLLNIRLMSYIFGLTLITNTGYRLLRGTRYSSRRSKDSGHAALFAAGLVAVGYLGVFFATIIKSIISQQREFLADASSVQFTRNPGAVVGVLKKLLAGKGGYIKNPEAVEINHMYFAKATSSFMLPTHPPLIKRIQAIQPSLSSKQIQLEQEGINRSIQSTLDKNTTLLSAHESKAQRLEIHESETWKSLAGLVITQQWLENNVGKISNEAIDYAESIIKKIPESIKLRLENTDECKKIIFEVLENTGHQISPQARLTIIKHAAHHLKTLPLTERQALVSDIFRSAKEDQQVTKHEIVVCLYVEEILLEPESKKTPHPASLCSLFSFLLNYHEDNNHREYYNRVSKKYYNSKLPPPTATTLESLQLALNGLKSISSSRKETLLKACIEIITADSKVVLGEFESLQLICEILEIPLPPIVPTH